MINHGEFCCQELKSFSSNREVERGSKKKVCEVTNTSMITTRNLTHVTNINCNHQHLTRGVFKILSEIHDSNPVFTKIVNG